MPDSETLLEVAARIEGPLPQRVISVDRDEKADEYRLSLSSRERELVAAALRRACGVCDGTGMMEIEVEPNRYGGLGVKTIDNLIVSLGQTVQRMRQMGSFDHTPPSLIRGEADLLAKCVEELRQAVGAYAPQAPAPDAKRIQEIVAEKDGFWRSCSGCYETEDGQNVHGYPHSNVFGCIIGSGCRECGGIGAVWDTTDYDDMATSILAASASSQQWQEDNLKLVKRPVAFRVPRVVDDKLSSTEWRLFSNENEAREAAYQIGAEYQALYNRDGTPLRIQEASEKGGA